MTARIKVITAEAKSNLYSVQSRLEQVQREVTTKQQRFEVEQKAAQHVTKQITIERDELLAKIDQLTNVNKREVGKQFIVNQRKQTGNS